MNASGPANDPSDEDKAAKAEPSEADAGAGTQNKDKQVSPTATGNEKDSAAEGLAAQKQAAQKKSSREQTQLTGFAGTMQFVGESLIEMRKVTWPDRQQVIKETLSVIVLVAIITACVLAFDFGIAKVVFEPLDKLARHLGGGIGVHH